MNERIKEIETLYMTSSHQTHHVLILTNFLQNVQFIHKIILISFRWRFWNHKYKTPYNEPLEPLQLHYINVAISGALHTFEWFHSHWYLMVPVLLYVAFFYHSKLSMSELFIGNDKIIFVQLKGTRHDLFV